MSIHQEVKIAGSPAAVYDMLTTSDKFAAMTGGRSADISNEAGGEIVMFGGDVEGRQIELIPGKRVVQAWRAKQWPEGMYSLCRFELEADGGGTRVVLDQVNYPDEAHEMLDGGWHQMYWNPMNATLGGK